jgi:hypothetical protein
MSAGLKLFFDECCSPRLPRELRDFYQRTIRLCKSAI